MLDARALMPPTLVALVLNALRSKFGMCTDPEISIEMDLGTFHRGRFEELLALGVNSVSLGVQAFQEELLRACGRAHGLKEVYEAIEIVTGYTPGKFPLPTETQSTNFYKMASEMLTKVGYSHYEISSYCKSGYECKHNLTYWQNRSFYGFGLGSTSYINPVRFSRLRRLKKYIDWVQKLYDGMVGHDATSVGSKDMAMDVVMLSLKTARGLDLSSFGRSIGDCLALSLCNALRPFVESGHVVAIDGDRKSLSLQDFEQQLNDDYEIGNKAAFIRLSDPDVLTLSLILMITKY